MIKVSLGEEIDGPRGDDASMDYHRRRHGKFKWTVEAHSLGGFSRQPLLDACRALSAAGIPDSEYAGLYRGDRLSMTCQVGYGRKMTVLEAPSEGPRLRRRPASYSDLFPKS